MATADPPRHLYQHTPVERTRDRFGLRQLRASMAAPRPAAGLTSEWRDVEGIRTHCRRSIRQPVSEPPIVLVHGLSVSHRYLTPLAAALAATHRVYVPDLPGFGLSGRPPVAYDVRQHAEHLSAWLAAYRLPPVCVVGHSFGAEVAAALASSRPDLVSAMVLAGATTDPAARSRRGQIGRWLLDTTREAPLQAPILLRDIWDARPWRVFATLSHSVHNAIEADLVRVTAPALVVAGGRDPVVPPPWRQELRRLLSSAPLVTVPAAAHNVATTGPVRVADAIRDFLARSTAHGQPDETTALA